MKGKLTILLITAFSACYVSAQEMRVEPGTAIKVETGTTLDISGSGLVLESDASGDASLLDFGSVTYSGGGEAKVQRYLTEGKWHLVSSPVSNAVSGMFLGDYLQSHAENDNGWDDIIPDNYNLGIMQGYALWSVEAAATTEVFSGTTNTGNQSKAFTQSGLGWNLVGNPYPSAIDWDAVAIPAELNGAIWLFDPTIGSNGDYRYYINGGGAANTTSQYIPSGQGFFVRATGGSGTLSFGNDERVHVGQAFYKSADNQMLVLKVTGNAITTQTAIRFNENATQEVDRLYDVYRIVSDSPEVPMLYTKAEGENMAINTLPAIEGNDTVPMWFRSGTSGEYTIKATEIGTFDSGTPIYLEDLQTGTLQNLRENPEYTFNYKTGSDKSFLVWFTEPQNSKTESDIKIFAYGNVLNVNFPSSQSANANFKARIMVFDINGKTVLQTKTTEIRNRIPLPGSNRIFIVKVISDGETANGKVFIK